MSWSISIHGPAAKVADAIENHSNNNMTGMSKEEWDEAKPHLLALVRANFASDKYKEQHKYEPLLTLSANGSASKDSDGNPLQGSCAVKLEVNFVQIV